MNNKVQVDRVYNHIYYMPEMPADINYRLIENTLGVQFHKAIKDYKDYYAGFGVGVQNQPYVFAMLGHNGKFFEIGGAGFWGLTINKASYEGWWYYYEPDFGPSFAKPVAKLNCNKDNLCCDDSPNGICYDYSHQETIIDNLEYIKLNKVNIFHSYAGFVAHASFYWEKFALSYAASMTNPWLVDELPVSEAHDADISFWFPVLLMQDIGISYTPNKIKYRLGINQITGIKSPGQYWGFSVQMAYMW
ncbi:MAG: hypothetical protein LBC75_06165 [Fibromonadaceae bacterium]|nr:hypothetical protein [Fibromonadaceae bacterium]